MKLARYPKRTAGGTPLRQFIAGVKGGAMAWQPSRKQSKALKIKVKGKA